MDQQIIDNNKLIADFMGYRHKGKPMAFMAINYKKLYHKDWNWLMPVVEKMNKISDATNYGHNIGIRYAQIKPVYKSVVEFIKWYNKEVK